MWNLRSSGGIAWDSPVSSLGRIQACPHLASYHQKIHVPKKCGDKKTLFFSWRLLVSVIILWKLGIVGTSATFNFLCSFYLQHTETTSYFNKNSCTCSNNLSHLVIFCIYWITLIYDFSCYFGMPPVEPCWNPSSCLRCARRRSSWRACTQIYALILTLQYVCVV